MTVSWVSRAAHHAYQFQFNINFWQHIEHTLTHPHTHADTLTRTHLPRLQAKFCNLQMQLRHSLLGLASFAFGQSDSCLKCVGNSNSSNYNSNSNNIDSSNSNFGSSSYNSPGHINKCQREKVTKPTDCCCSIWILQALCWGLKSNYKMQRQLYLPAQ